MLLSHEQKLTHTHTHTHTHSPLPLVIFSFSSLISLPFDGFCHSSKPSTLKSEISKDYFHFLPQPHAVSDCLSAFGETSVIPWAYERIVAFGTEL